MPDLGNDQESLAFWEKTADMTRNMPIPEATPELRLTDQPVMRLHLWLETEKGIIFGLGRQRILECIQSGMSLKAAADQLGMSYRAAWGKIKRTEKVLGITLIEKKGGNRSGYQLSPAGEMLMSRFKQWYEEVEQFALARSRVLMPCHPLGFEEACVRPRAESSRKS